MPKIYINNVLQKVEILASNTPTEDETLETLSFSLISNTNPLPLAPGQKVKVDLFGDESEIINLIIATDSVETFSLKPLRYKHSISCVQNTRALSKHLVRNSVFTQPSYLQKGSFNATNCGVDGSFSSGEPVLWTQLYVESLNWASEKLTLDKNEKIKNPYLKISFQYGVSSGSANTGYFYTKAHTTNDILQHSFLVKTLNFNDTFTLRYKDSFGTTHTQVINAATFGVSKIDLNATYSFPLIKSLADQGCNDFEILFNSLEVLTGTYRTSEEIGPTDPLQQIEYYQIQVQIVADTYYWSCYDILDLLLKRQQRFTSIRGDNPLFTLPESGELYDLLKNSVAPNFTFTQLTMYECVAEVFRLFDAIFTLDENGVLGIDYFNDLSRENINQNARFTGRNLALGEDKYTNGFVSYYQDARTIEAFPKEEGIFAPVRSAEFGIPEAQDHSFIVPHNIDSIIKCEILVDKFDINDGAKAEHCIDTFALDITKMVVTEDVWSTLDTGDISGQEFINRKIKQANTVYYTRGDNKIQLAATFKSSWNLTKYNLYNLVEFCLVRMAGASAGVEPTDDYKAKWSKIRLRLVYTTTVDGVAKTHSIINKYDGESLVDQANGGVDLNKLGLNMLGLSLKLGNPTLNATHRLTKWANRIKVGQIYNWQGKTWIANVVNYTFFNGLLQGKVSFIQNFNSLALRTQLLREKRMSNISRELVQKSEDILTDFAYYSSVNPEHLGLQIHFRNVLFQEFVYDSFKLNGPYHKIGDAFIYDRYEVDLNRKVKAVYIPTIRYGAGNTVNFEMSFDHPMNAGNQTTIKSGTWLGENERYFTSHVIYTTNNDDELVFYLGDNDDKFSAGFLDKVSIKFPEGSNQYDTDFPIVTINANRPSDLTTNGYINIINYEVYKQPNEIFALNYQIAFLPLPGRENTDFIGSEWINNNCFVSDIERNVRRFSVVFRNEKASVLDLKAATPYVKKQITNVELVPINDDKFKIEFTMVSIPTAPQYNDAKSWAIVDENDNVLFASNYKQPYGTKVTIYFFTRPNRLN